MRYPLFSEIAHDDDPVLNAYEAVNLEGDITKDPLATAIAAHVEANGGDPKSPEVQIAVRDRVIGALIAQKVNLWTDFGNASRDSERNKKYLEEKMDEVAKLRAKETMNEIVGKYRLKGLPNSGDDDSSGDG